MTSKYRAEFILIITTLLAGAGWVFSKEAIQGLPPFGFIGLRFVFASLILLPFCLRALKAASLADCLRAMSVGCFLGSAIFCWIYAISISDTLGEGAFIMSLSMLFVPIVAWIMFKTKPIRAFWLSLPIAVAGLFLLSWRGSWQIDASQLWFLGSAVGLALHFNFNSKYSVRLSTMLLTTLQLFSTGCLGIVLSLMFESWPDQISATTWNWFVLSVLLATSLRYLMQTTGQKFAHPTNAALLMLLEPVWTLILSVIIYAEPMPINKILGCLLLLFSLIFYRLSSLMTSRKFNCSQQ
ncbi:DMT family transporter [Vibrio hangzhouensis]|uniref:EamA domain-containing membrane protein RarD n=1 Tax=Vibrio hangzhouensis TaxID=462991 RepID=A0A1H5XWP5_9VIBR|nr:DMT family transporter [Vibrio hangzhouensis]SEG16088.1 EamA domain-containing membrane protein RarD [Vibrio hangzhouensis]